MRKGKTVMAQEGNDGSLMLIVDDDQTFTAVLSRAMIRRGYQTLIANNTEQAYQLAQDAYQKAGREVLDATINGKLTIFPKVEYNSLFE